MQDKNLFIIGIFGDTDNSYGRYVKEYIRKVCERYSFTESYALIVSSIKDADYVSSALWNGRNDFKNERDDPVELMISQYRSITNYTEWSACMSTPRYLRIKALLNVYNLNSIRHIFFICISPDGIVPSDIEFVALRDYIRGKCEIETADIQKIHLQDAFFLHYTKEKGRIKTNDKRLTRSDISFIYE